MSSAFTTAGGGGQAHQRERTQLFANVGTYNPAEMRRSASPRVAPAAARAGGGSYSDRVLNQLESQNDESIDGLTAKVRVLKDISLRIGDEVRDSTTLLTTLEDGFEGARTRVKATMGRMLATSRQHGIGLRHWLGFFVFVWVCFFIVWLT